MASVLSYVGKTIECRHGTVGHTFHCSVNCLLHGFGLAGAFRCPFAPTLNDYIYVFFAMRLLDEKKGKNYDRTAMKQTFTASSRANGE